MPNENACPMVLRERPVVELCVSVVTFDKSLDKSLDKSGKIKERQDGRVAAGEIY